MAPDTVHVVAREELSRLRHWREAFADERKDRRHFELVEDTIHQGFAYRYFAVTDEQGDVCAVQPFFILDQDLLAGTGPGIRALGAAVRRICPRFLTLRTLMVGCAVGEGHLDTTGMNQAHLERLAAGVVKHARALRARLVVLKEFPAHYRGALECFLAHGYTRVPSFPMTRLNIDYPSFEDYMVQALSRRTRRDLRLKFKAAARAQPIDQSILGDITSVIDEVYPLYLDVYHRSKHQFEKLTKEYLCGLGRLMPDKVRFFVWRQGGRIVAFTVCMMQSDNFYAEYIGLEYPLALELHLYHYAVRDMVTWAMRHGYKWFCSSGLNYDPKFHLRCTLDPLDLYVRHTSWLMNAVLKRALPWLAPVRYDETLRRFANYADMWASPSIPGDAGWCESAGTRSAKSKNAAAVGQPALAEALGNE